MCQGHGLDAIPECVSAFVFWSCAWARSIIRLDAVPECESVFYVFGLCPLQHRLDAIQRGMCILCIYTYMSMYVCLYVYACLPLIHLELCVRERELSGC